MVVSKKKKKIIVNGLSLSRIAGALALPLVFNFASIPVLIGLIACLFATDFLDGKLARKWEVQTYGGALLDPLGDKVLAVSCILSLIGTQTFLLLPLFLEIGIAALNISRALHEENVKSTIIGKIKTAVLSCTVVLCAINVLDPELLNTLANFIPGLHLPDLTVTTDVVRIASSAAVGSQMAAVLDYLHESHKQKDIRSEKIAELKGLKESLIRLFDETKYEEDKDKPFVKVIKK